MTARVFEEKVTKLHLLGVLERDFVPMSDQFTEEIKASIKHLEQHGFRNVTAEEENKLPPAVPDERRRARGRLVPALVELWRAEGAGLAVITSGGRKTTLRMETRCDDRRSVWLAPGDVKEWPPKWAESGRMERQDGRLVITLEKPGEKGAPQERRIYLEWNPDEQSVEFAGETAGIEWHPEVLARPEKAKHAAPGEAKRMNSTEVARLQRLDRAQLLRVAKDRGIRGPEHLSNSTLIDRIVKLGDREHQGTLRGRSTTDHRTQRNQVQPGDILEYYLHGNRQRIELPRRQGAGAVRRWGINLTGEARYKAERKPGGNWFLVRESPVTAVSKHMSIDVDSVEGVRIYADGSQAKGVRWIEAH